MDDDIRRSYWQRIASSRRVGVASVSAMALAVAAALAALGSATASATQGPAAPTPTPVTTETPAATAPAPMGGPEILSGFGLPLQFASGEAAILRAIIEFTEIAGAPTATATAPLPPPPPPTPTPTTSRRAAPPLPTVALPTAVPPTAIPPTATAVPPTPAPAPSSLDTSPMDAYARNLFDLTNARRVAAGLSPLRENGLLNGIARIRSAEMAQYNYFAHESPVTGHNAFSLMDVHGVPYAWAGENLAKNNYPDAEAVGVAEQALWDSQGHRENTLGPHYTDVGMALVIDGSGMKYFTIIFTGP